MTYCVFILFSLNDFLIPRWFFSITYLLFMNMLLNVHILVDFSVLFLLLIYSLISLWTKKILLTFWSLWSIFLRPIHMTYSREYSICTWDDSMFLLWLRIVVEMFYRWLLSLLGFRGILMCVWLVFFYVFIFADLLSCYCLRW